MRTILRRASVAGLTLLMVLPGLATAGAVSSGGPWTYQTFYVTCKFTGDHGSQNGYAFARTTDFNGGCAKLRVRLKANPGAFDWGWRESTGAPGAYMWFDNAAGSTAISSQHRAQEGFQDSWSQVEQPHAF
jgi:hypothetical protein